MEPVSSHIEALVWAGASTSGPILELGGGEYSTSVLAGFAGAGRECWTVETDPAWAQRLGELYGHLVHITDTAPSRDWAVVLVDQAPGSARADAVRRYRDRAWVVVHDTELEVKQFYPGLREVIAESKQMKIVFSAGPWMPETTLLVP